MNNPFNSNIDNNHFMMIGFDSIEKSSPIVFTAYNRTGTDQNNVDILDAYANVDGSFISPEGTKNRESGISTVTYRQMLRSLMTNPIRIGKTKIVASNTNQLFQPMLINAKNSAGNRKSISITPAQYYDLYQRQSNSFVFDKDYILDGYASFTVNKLLAGQYLTFYVYPVEELSGRHRLRGKDETKKYSEPILSPYLRMLKGKK